MYEIRSRRDSNHRPFGLGWVLYQLALGRGGMVMRNLHLPWRPDEQLCILRRRAISSDFHTRLSSPGVEPGITTPGGIVPLLRPRVPVVLALIARQGWHSC